MSNDSYKKIFTVGLVITNVTKTRYMIIRNDTSNIYIVLNYKVNYVS